MRRKTLLVVIGVCILLVLTSLNPTASIYVNNVTNSKNTSPLFTVKISKKDMAVTYIGKGKNLLSVPKPSNLDLVEIIVKLIDDMSLFKRLKISKGSFPLLVQRALKNIKPGEIEQMFKIGKFDMETLLRLKVKHLKNLVSFPEPITGKLDTLPITSGLITCKGIICKVVIIILLFFVLLFSCFIGKIEPSIMIP